MKRLGPVLLALALSPLHGCPIDQPLPVFKGPTQSPPRIVFELLSPKDAIVDVSKACPSTPQFTLQAAVRDENVDEAVEARWFVDYDKLSNVGLADSDEPPGNPNDSTRTIRPFVWSPLDYGSFLTPVHVVELVVSNGFYELNHPGLELPNRSPRDGFETQVFRWVFRYADTGGLCQSPP